MLTVQIVNIPLESARRASPDFNISVQSEQATGLAVETGDSLHD
jgi:hypothetical protein